MNCNLLCLVSLLLWKETLQLWKENDIVMLNYTSSESLTYIDDKKKPLPIDISYLKYVTNIYIRAHHECSGAYIKPFWVLTTAVCISEYAEHDYTVYMGGSRLDAYGSQLRQVDKVIPHEKFSEYPPRFNIGLIKLKRPFVLHQTIAMVKMATDDSLLNTTCTLIGWGLSPQLTERKGTESIEYMEVDIIGNDDCKYKYEENKAAVVIDTSIICANTSCSHDYCIADVGATMLCGGLLTGITSSAVKCWLDMPLIIFKVSSFSSWMEQQITAYYTHEEDLEDTGNCQKAQLISLLLITILNKGLVQYTRFALCNFIP